MSFFKIFSALTLTAAIGIANRPAEASLQISNQISLKGWASETIILPPDFAPTMPKGKESLKFAPGWSDPKAEGFWSYALVFQIEEPVPSKKRIDTLIETYYNGLLSSFAKNANKDISGTPVKVEVTQESAGKYSATMTAIDAFATYKPIKVRFEIEAVAVNKSRSSLRIKLSPQPKEHAIWKSLDAAVAQILKEIND